VAAIEGYIEQSADHQDECGNDSDGFDSGAGQHQSLDAGSREQEVEAPSGLEPEPQV
jgi:hypothetical protein